RAGDLECHFRGVHIVIRTVVEDHSKIYSGKTSQHAFLSRFLDSLFNRRNKVPRNRATENFIHEFEVPAAWKRFHPDFAVAILTVATALLFVLPLHVRFALDRFAIRNLRRMQQYFDAVPLLQTCYRYFDVDLALT